MQQYISPLPLSRFHYNRENQTLSTEISNFTDYETKNCFLVKMYDDACDVGINILSETTEKSYRFYLSDTKIDSDDDVQFWEFKPEETKCPIKKVIVFND